MLPVPSRNAKRFGEPHHSSGTPRGRQARKRPLREGGCEPGLKSSGGKLFRHHSFVSALPQGKPGEPKSQTVRGGVLPKGP